MNREKLFTDQLPVIDRLISWRCREYGLSRDEGEDLSQQIKLRLIENDYGIFNKFKQRSSLKSFLHVVIANLAKDFLIAKNGKRRPTAAAKRLGPVAEKLEELLKDGHPFDEAVKILRLNCKVDESENDLYEIARQLRLRPRRKIESDAQLITYEDPKTKADPAIQSEQNHLARRLEKVLSKTIKDLSDPEDRFLLTARFFKGLSVVQIARTLSQPPQQLYRRIAQLCQKDLRQTLEAEGLDKETVLALLGEGIKVEVDE